MNYQAYVTALIEQVAVHCRQLDSLSAKNSPLSQLERSAAERSLQILVESAIGSAKHLNKKQACPKDWTVIRLSSSLPKSSISTRVTSPS